MSSGLRSRAPIGKQPLLQPDVNRDNGKKTKQILSAFVYLTPLHWILFTLYIILIYFWVVSFDSKLPEPISSQTAGNIRFSEERARQYLNNLAGFGPRPSGSHNSEILARNYLISQIEEIKKNANTDIRMEMDIQKPSGCFELDSDYFNCYKNVTNIIVRIGPKSTKYVQHSLLINSHFDSVAQSPGATDDAISCAIMLELINIFVQGDSKQLPYDLIFLFNGAEENYLQASHGFITQHPYRHTIRTFINLEACGSSGRELLFQVGAGHAWLSHAYLNNAPYPHCNVIAQELFQNDFIPSDTDFRIFRDHGHAAGMDFAYISNGYVYHTEFDHPSFVRPGSIQRSGDNLHITILAVLNSPCFTRPCPEQDTKLVFFDVLGLFAVYYPLSIGTLINYAVVILIIILIIRQFQHDRRGHSECYGISDFLLAFGAHFISTLAMIGMAWIMIKFAVLADLVMCWYSRPILVVPLYLTPTLVVGFAVHVLISSKMRKSAKDTFKLELASFHAALLLLTIILLILTFYEIAGAYFVLLHVLLPLVRDILMGMWRRIGGKRGHSSTVLFLCHTISMSPIMIIGSYAMFTVLQFFIPIMGRTGTVANPEYFIAFICSSCSIVIVLYMAGLVHISKSLSEYLKFVTFLTVLMLAIASLTTFGTPYRYDPQGPRLRRMRMQHVSRKIYDLNDQVISNENGLFITGMDYRGVEDLPPATFHQGSEKPPCLHEDAYCGLPYYSPSDDFCPPEKNLWISVPSSPRFQTPTSIKMTSKVMENNMIKMNFTVNAHDYASLFITPLNNWTVYHWSFTNWFLYPHQTYFIRLHYVGRIDDIGPWTFSITLKPPSDTIINSKEDQAKVLVGVASHYIHGPNKDSDALVSLVNSIRERRENPPTASFGYWKWMMNVDSFNSEYVAQYFE